MLCANLKWCRCKKSEELVGSSLKAHPHLKRKPGTKVLIDCERLLLVTGSAGRVISLEPSAEYCLDKVARSTKCNCIDEKLAPCPGQGGLGWKGTNSKYAEERLNVMG